MMSGQAPGMCGGWGDCPTSEPQWLPGPSPATIGAGASPWSQLITGSADESVHM